MLVSLGGDVRVAGAGDPWPVRVTECPDAGPAQGVRLVAGGLAASSTLAGNVATIDRPSPSASNLDRQCLEQE